MWVVPSDRDRTYFRQNRSQEFLAGYLAAYRVEFRGQPGRSCDAAAIYISDPLPGCTHDAKGISPPRRSPRLSRTPVAGSWIKAQRHQRWRSDLLCAATERGTLRIKVCAAIHARPTLARWRGDRGHRLGRTQQCCFTKGGAVDRWERLRDGAFGFGLYLGGGYPDPALAEIALLWMADRARERGLVLQADAFPASPENATQAPQDRMALRRSQPAGNAAPIPHGLGSPAHPGAGHGRRQVRRPSRVRPSRESTAVEVYQKPHSLLRVDEEKVGRQLGGASGAPRTTPEYEIPCNETGQQARARAV